MYVRQPVVTNSSNYVWWEWKSCNQTHEQITVNNSSRVSSRHPHLSPAQSQQSNYTKAIAIVSDYNASQRTAEKFYDSIVNSPVEVSSHVKTLLKVSLPLFSVHGVTWSSGEVTIFMSSSSISGPSDMWHRLTDPWRGYRPNNEARPTLEHSSSGQFCSTGVVQFGVVPRE